MGGITITGVKIVGMCSKCREEGDEIMKDKYGRVYRDEELSCVGCAITMSYERTADLALSMYVGVECSECGHKFDSVQDIKNRKVKCSGKDPLTFACGECFDAQNRRKVQDK